MNRLLRAEISKVKATPMTWWLLLGTVAIGVVGTLAPLIAADGRPVDLLSDHQLRAALHGAAAGSFLVMVAGIIGMAGEWRFGQATQAFLTAPRRWGVVTVKTVTYMGIGTLYGVVADAAATGTAWAWYRHEHLTLPIGRPAVWQTLLGCLAVAIVYGVLGVGIGAVARRLVPAIVVTLAWWIVVEPALFAAAPRIFRWLPGIAALSLRRQPADDLLPVIPAAAVLLGVTVAVLAVGALLVERDDVTV